MTSEVKSRAPERRTGQGPAARGTSEAVKEDTRRGAPRDWTDALDNSPRLTAQRALTQSAVGGAVDSNRAPVQRDPGDEPLLTWIGGQRNRADAAYALLTRQVGVLTSQIIVIEQFANAIPGDPANAAINDAKARVAEGARHVRGSIGALPQEAQAPLFEARAADDVASIDTPHALIVQWSKEATSAASAVVLAQAKASAFLMSMRDLAKDVAKTAHGAAEVGLMSGLLRAADALHAEVEEPRQIDVSGGDEAASSGKQKLGLATAAADSLNNATTGVAFSTVGALQASGSMAVAAPAAAVMGVVGGVLGIFFGAIGVFLGVKNAYRGIKGKKALKKAQSELTSGAMDETVDYAIGQKEKKTKRNVAAAVGGAIAIGAGVIGLIALSVASFGTAAIVAGLVAGLIGLGFVGFKIIRSWWKRRSERAMFADELIGQIAAGGEEADQARSIVTEVGMDPTKSGEKGFRKGLASKMGGYIQSKRQRVASGLIEALMNGTPSESFDAELILDALNVPAAWVRGQVEAGTVMAAMSKVADKMASW